MVQSSTSQNSKPVAASESDSSRWSLSKKSAKRSSPRNQGVVVSEILPTKTQSAPLTSSNFEGECSLF